MVNLTVNGSPITIPGPLSVPALLQHVGRDPAVPGVAVAVGDRVVRRAEWDDTTVADGDRIEIITAAQGG